MGTFRKESKMSTKGIVQSVIEEVKSVLAKAAGALSGEVTPERAEEVGRALTRAMSAGWVAGFRTWLEEHEAEEETIRREGKVYRYKLDSEKEFLTPGGLMKVRRRVYQPDAGGKCFIPLDAAWGMEGEFAAVEVRDAVLFSVALSTPKETETLLKKCALFQPSETAIKTMAKEMGMWLEEHEDQVLTEIRAEESLPEETQVLCASLDGVNVLLAEGGKKRGRPRERPRGPAETRESPTSYKNAMVATVSLYGEVPEGDHCPRRLQTRYAARMPEEGAPTLKSKFEQEVLDTERGLDDEVVRIALCDGARALWKYIDESPLYDDYEKLVDYHHTTDHLSKAAEAIFGKGTEQSRNWYDKYREALKGEDDGAERVMRSIDYYAQAKKLPKSRQESLQSERTFFRNNRHRMEYARFRRQGWPIGSGPVEAACKSLVKTRLCRSGMRWSRNGGQHILTLRTYVKSDRWDIMWEKHKAALRHRLFSNST
jgi:hypothetical protein